MINMAVSTCCKKKTINKFVWPTKEKFIVLLYCTACGNQCECEFEEDEEDEG